jgi:hypothetical protein
MHDGLDLNCHALGLLQAFIHTEAARNLPVIGGADALAGHVRRLGYRVGLQTSIFFEISIASSTSMPPCAPRNLSGCHDDGFRAISAAASLAPSILTHS